jgi:hypothetical protein
MAWCRQGVTAILRRDRKEDGMRTDQPPETIVCPLTPLERAHHR